MAATSPGSIHKSACHPLPFSQAKVSGPSCHKIYASNYLHFLLLPTFSATIYLMDPSATSFIIFMYTANVLLTRRAIGCRSKSIRQRQLKRLGKKRGLSLIFRFDQSCAANCAIFMGLASSQGRLLSTVSHFPIAVSIFPRSSSLANGIHISMASDPVLVN